MSRSSRAARYAPPPGFVIATSRDPGIEVYAPATPVTTRFCAGCAGMRTADPCLRCGEQALVQAHRLQATLTREEAVERARSWLAAVIRPAPEALAAIDQLQPTDLPCSSEGKTLGGGPELTLPTQGTREPLATLPTLERPLPDAHLLVVPTFTTSFERDGRTGWIVVSAVDGTVTGDRPVDGARLRLYALAGLLPGALLGFCLGTPSLLLAGFGLLIWAVALALLVLGQVRWARLERAAYGAQRW